MALASKPLAAIAFLALLPLGACATTGAAGYGEAAGSGYRAADGAAVAQAQAQPLTPLEPRDGLLSSPPNTARPGECYAKVVVPGQPIGAPPSQPRAVWVQTPPRPGQISPTWCIYYLPGAPRPVAWTPERYGWIRVICDKDATVETIRHVQRRLHAWGDYDGGYDGHYDAVTAKGVARFQEQRRIAHGGYLSVKTLQALDAAPPPGTLVPAFDAGHPNPNPPLYAGAPCQTACAPAPSPVIYAPPAPPQVVIQRVIQPVYIPAPVACGQPACAPQPYPCGGVSCGSPAGPGWNGPGQGGTPPYRALLAWPGKTVY